MKVRLRLFGSPAVLHGAQCIALPFERRTQLIVYLALHRGWVGRAELAALLWPELERKLAYANLRKTLFRLQALPWAAGLELQGGAARFQVETDVDAFEAALQGQRGADALALVDGPLLAGFDDDANEAWSGWLHFGRDRLKAAWRGAALARLAQAADPAADIALSARLLEADPLDEAALRAHMACLAQQGQSSRARQAYQAFAARLAADLGVAPAAELKALHDTLGSSAVWIPPATPSAAAADDGFVGRTVELRRIATLLLQEDCRLLCIVGPGGVGKTRLARRAMQEVAAHLEHGATFVALEELASTDQIASRLACELGLTAVDRSDASKTVIEFLRERQTLLVLDNFEHLVSDTTLLERLLLECPRLRIVVTSRVRLALRSAWLMPLDGLPCPDRDDLDRIETFDAARLFVQAARRVEPALVPAVEAASIVEICCRLEGLPLALELAAAWTRVLSCDAIAAELRRGSELLHAVDAAHPARHASFEQVFEQSWRLLGAVERDALARLSVFRGGFSADAARAVAGASLPVLGALADKSLLRKDGTRIHMHPLVQQFAAARLGDGDGRTATDAAHARYFHLLLAQWRRGVEAGDGETLRAMDPECDNCKGAWLWAVEQGYSEVLAQSSECLVQFCDHRGRLEEGRSLLRHALGSGVAQADSHLRALLLSKVAHLEYRTDRYADAEAAAMQALTDTPGEPDAPDHETRLQCLKVLGSSCLRLGRHADARRYFEQALQHAPADADPRTRAAMLSNLALVEKSTGHYDEALRFSIDALEQQRRIGDPAGEALSLNNLGALHLDREEFASAGEYLKPGLALCDRHGLLSTRGLILANLTSVALNTGQHDAAEAYAQRALEHAEAAGNRYLIAYLKLQFVRLALQRADPTRARGDLRSALEITIAIARPSLLIEAVICFAEILAAQGESHAEWLILGFAAHHPSTAAPERDKLRARLGAAGRPVNPAPPWPGLGLDELVHRIVFETEVAYAPLIAKLRAISVAVGGAHHR